MALKIVVVVVAAAAAAGGGVGYLIFDVDQPSMTVAGDEVQLSHLEHCLHDNNQNVHRSRRFHQSVKRNMYVFIYMVITQKKLSSHPFIYSLH